MPCQGLKCDPHCLPSTYPAAKAKQVLCAFEYRR